MAAKKYKSENFITNWRGKSEREFLPREKIPPNTYLLIAVTSSMRSRPKFTKTGRGSDLLNGLKIDILVDF